MMSFSFVISRNRIPSEYIGYGLYFYFSGLSLRKAVVDRLSDCFIKRNHVSIWNWIQKYNPQKISLKKKKISGCIIDETVIKVGPEYIWVWVATIEPENKEILGISTSKEQNMFLLLLNDLCRML
jgi:putative transposase